MLYPYMTIWDGIAALHRLGVEHVVAEPESHLAGGVLILRGWTRRTSVVCMLGGWRGECMCLDLLNNAKGVVPN